MRHVSGTWPGSGTVMPTRSASVGAACMEVRNSPITGMSTASRPPWTPDRCVRGDRRVVAVLRRPEDLAHDRQHFHHVMQAVEHALGADRLIELRALVIVREYDLDLGAWGSIAVELRFDPRRLIGGRSLPAPG